MNSQIGTPTVDVVLDVNTYNGETSVTNMAAGRKKFLICAVGVFVSYFYYGILQETM